MIHGKRILVLLVALLTGATVRAVAAEAPLGQAKPILLGSCTRDSLQQQPYVDWYTKNYEAYTPNAEVISELDKLPSDYEVVVFFGSWCGDSKRQVPRFLKVLDALSFPAEKLSLIGVSNVDSLKKQSPDGEERHQQIYRVPVFIVKRNGDEINRIVEYPVSSLERDLLQIVSDGEYSPNYRSFPRLTEWLQEGLLTDVNVSYRGLANQIRTLVATEGELHAAAVVLVGRGLVHEAVQVFRMNAYLYPESVSRRLALAQALFDAGDDAEAESALKKALELNDDPKRQDDILELWDRVRDRLQFEAAQEDTSSEE